MTLEQSIDLAELQADMAFDAYLAAFDEDAHPEFLDSLETEALIARSCESACEVDPLGWVMSE
ncbi:hypothetical protein PhaeoP24_03844 (plasmid) [Phaeobacter inhibens]|uniref:hypothetical protein n=1 Tax=Phaeobacter inhibens TaxID=221822 RepID=UPI000C9B7E5B|nr:hypothetical protein [Phaeobacter inhibens]AUQ92402.1 hypothetical protein PhaeoP24_03844 [Phaeobacter inhibens]